MHVTKGQDVPEIQVLYVQMAVEGERVASLKRNLLKLGFHKCTWLQLQGFCQKPSA